MADSFLNKLAPLIWLLCCFLCFCTFFFSSPYFTLMKRVGTFFQHLNASKIKKSSGQGQMVLRRYHYNIRWACNFLLPFFFFKKKNFAAPAMFLKFTVNEAVVEPMLNFPRLLRRSFSTGSCLFKSL